MGQSLVGIKNILSIRSDRQKSNYEGIEKSVKKLEELINEVRSISHQMMPSVLTKFGLADALKIFLIIIYCLFLANLRYLI